MRAAGPAPPPPVASARPRFAAFHSGNFRLLWSGLIISNAGSQMQTVAQGYLIYYVLTHSPFWLGMVSLAFAIPMSLLPLFGGAIADRVDKLALLKVTQSGQMLNAAVLTAVTLSGQVTVWWIVGASFVGACFLAADNPARQALLPELVPREDLVSAAALNGASYTGAALIGPALGGVLLPLLGPPGLFLLNTISFGAVLIALFLMRGVHSAPHPGATSVGAGLQQLYGYVKQERGVRTLLLLAAAVGFFGRSYIQLTPAFGRDILHVDALGLGLLYAAPGLGALVAAALLAGGRTTRVHARLLVGAVLLFAGLLIVYSFNAWLLPALLLLVGTGIGNQVGATMISTSLQLQVPGRLRGRVLSLYAITIIGFASLGALASASLAELVGPGLAVATGAVVMGAAAIVAAPRLGRLDAPPEPTEAPAPVLTDETRPHVTGSRNPLLRRRRGGGRQPLAAGDIEDEDRVLGRIARLHGHLPVRDVHDAQVAHVPRRPVQVRRIQIEARLGADEQQALLHQRRREPVPVIPTAAHEVPLAAEQGPPATVELRRVAGEGTHTARIRDHAGEEGGRGLRRHPDAGGPGGLGRSERGFREVLAPIPIESLLRRQRQSDSRRIRAARRPGTPRVPPPSAVAATSGVTVTTGGWVGGTVAAGSSTAGVPGAWGGLAACPQAITSRQMAASVSKSGPTTRVCRLGRFVSMPGRPLRGNWPRPPTASAWRRAAATGGGRYRRRRLHAGSDRAARPSPARP